jgi:putative cofactor-binding repeat protein
MPTATWKGAVIAQSHRCVKVEGNWYFPRKDVHNDRLWPSTTQTVCGWKGTASYYDVVVDGNVVRDAAWYYPDPLPAAENIRGYIAFWKGVEVVA